MPLVGSPYQMKRHKKRKRPHASPRTPKGFDFGCLPFAMGVGSFDFPAHLSAASVGAVAYGSAWSEVIGKTVPTISLVAMDGDELAKAFDIFNAWSKATDPDSVELTFAFRKSGGYVLAISAEPSRLTQRTLGFDRTHRTMLAGATWFKPMDSTHPLLLRFRERCSAPIAPFLFEGVRFPGPPSGLRSSPVPTDLARIPGLQPLLKFEVQFVDEDQARPETIGWLALNSGHLPVSKLPDRTKSESKDIARQRVETLKCHFPVTLERLRRGSTMTDLAGQLVMEGILAWQIEQAICNLVLSKEIGCGLHYVGLNGHKVEATILQAMRSRHEIADGENLPQFALNDVRTQILADGNALLRYLGQESAEQLVSLQENLKSVSALEGSPALADVSLMEPAE